MTKSPKEIAADLEALAGKATPGPLKTVALAHVVREPIGGSDHGEFRRGDNALFKAYRNNHAAIVKALGEVERMREALAFGTPQDAYDNLLGASLDLENSNGNDKVTQKTIKRVLGQLAAARRALGDAT